MWPWGHLAVGYLVYAGVLDRRFRRSPGGLAVLVVAIATQLPDLVDKPLAWRLGVIPHGRSLAHSVLVATVVILVVWWVLRSAGRGDLAVAFGVGYASHLAADAIRPALAGEWAQLAFLGWPLFALPPDADTTGVVAYFVTLARELAAGEVSWFFLAQLALVVLAAASWAAHGYPGVDVLRRSRRVGERSAE